MVTLDDPANTVTIPFGNHRAFMKTLALIIATGLACVAPAIHAQTELRDAMTEVDEVVIDTTFEIPLELLSETYPFKNFRYPFVDKNGQVLFIGNDWFKYNMAEHHNGVYQSTPDGVLTPLATQEMIVKEDGEPLGPILGLRTDFESIVFQRFNGRGRSLMGLIRGGPMRELVGQGTIAPGSNVPFKYFLFADIQSNWMVFNGTTNSDPWINGLYHMDVDTGTMIRLIQNDQFIASLGFIPGNLSWQPDLSTERLVFGANQLDEKGEECLPARGILGWRINLEENPEEQFSIDKLEVLAPFGMEIPESGGLPLQWANNPVTDGDWVAVVGGHDPDDHMSQPPAYQAILIRTPDGIWHNPVDTDTYIPGHRAENAVFTSFNQWIGLSEGKVVFIARGPDDYQAIYIYDSNDSGLYFVIDTERPIDGRQPIGFEISSNPLVGQRLAFMAQFDDKTSGIFGATLPGLKVSPGRKAEE